MNKAHNFFIIFFFVASLYGFSQKSGVSVEKNTILIGEQTKLSYQFTFPPSATSISIPLIEGDTLTSHIEIIERLKTDTLLTFGKILGLNQHYIITSFDSGTHTIPSLPFSWYMPGDTSAIFAYTDSLLLTVRTVAADTTQPIKDIKAPWDIPFQWRDYIWHAIIGLIILLLIAASIYYFMRRRKGLPLFPARQIQILPPHEEAIRALDRIRKEKIWRTGLVKDYYTVLTDTLRHYIKRRFDIQSMEMTTTETVSALSETDTTAEAREKMEHILLAADLVKFARSQPVPTENEHCLDLAYQFVLSTKKDEEPENNSTKSSDEQKNEL